jgi:hypothetical protein
MVGSLFPKDWEDNMDFAWQQVKICRRNVSDRPHYFRYGSGSPNHGHEGSCFAFFQFGKSMGFGVLSYVYSKGSCFAFFHFVKSWVLGFYLMFIVRVEIESKMFLYQMI